jgi:uncharacterized protein YmfQ (DUF2313 family)
MTITAHTSADFLQQLIALAPTGLAWPTDPNSDWVKLLSCIADTLAILDANNVSLLSEMFMDTTTQMISDWERIAGIPDACLTIGETLQIRRANLITKMTNTGGQSKAYFLKLAQTLGFNITIKEFAPFRVGISRVGDMITDDLDWNFVWEVQSQLNTIVYFRAGKSTAGEPLEFWSNARLECFFNRYKPAHTLLLFSYS